MLQPPISVPGAGAAELAAVTLLSPGHPNTEQHRWLRCQCQQPLPRGNAFPSIAQAWGDDMNLSILPQWTLDALLS